MDILELKKDPNYGIEYIVCPICGHRMKHLHWSHAKKHDTTRKQIQLDHPEFQLTRDKTKAKYKEAGSKFSDKGIESIRQATIKRNLENNPMNNPINVQKSVANFKKTHRHKWKNDPEYRRKWSENSSRKMTKLHQDPEFHERRSSVFLSYVRSDIHKERTRQLRLENWKDPEYSTSMLSKALGFGVFYVRRNGSTIRLKSRYELAFAITMDYLGINFEYEPTGFEYKSHNETHMYFPDFLCDGVYYEIKGYKDKLTDIKLRYCRDTHGVDIRLLEGEELFQDYSILPYDVLVRLAPRNETVSYEQVIAEYKSLN
ncbi:endonuclease [Listeria phage LIS04]|nr:endonuclease [Listeria phage LIS04]